MLRTSDLDDVVEDVRRGRPVIVARSERERDLDRAPDVVVAGAEVATAETIDVLLTLGHGRLYLALTPDRCDQLGLRPLARDADRWTHSLMTSIDSRGVDGVGVSAADRTTTVRAALGATACRADFTSPGHVFPVRAERGGTLVRAGQAEAAVDLARLAGLSAAAAMSEILTETGSVVGAERLAAVAEDRDLTSVSIGSILAHRRATERVIERVASTLMPTAVGDFRAVGFRDRLTGVHHVGLLKGDLNRGDPPIVAVEYQCRLGTALRSTACRCRERQLDALGRIQAEGRGILLHLSRSAAAPLVGEALLSCEEYADGGRAAPRTQVGGPPAWRDVEIAGGVLRALDIGRIRLLTSRPMSDEAFSALGVEVAERLTIARPREHRRSANA